MASAEVAVEGVGSGGAAVEVKTETGTGGGGEKGAASTEGKAAVTVKANANLPSLSDSPKAWLNSLQGGALRKLGYVVLEWMQKATGQEGDVPGAAKGEVSASEFVAALKDGTGLCKLANAMETNAVPEIAEAKEGEELTTEQRRANLDAFKNFAKEKVGVAEADLYKTEKVEKGKGFKGLLSTLIGLATTAYEKFQKEGLSVETLLELGVAAFGKNFLTNLFNRFFKRGSNNAVKTAANGDSNAAPSATAATTAAAPSKDDDIPAADADPPKEEEAKKD